MKELDSNFSKELAKYNLLEPFLKRKILFALVSGIEISDELRSNTFKLFLQSRKIEPDQLDAYLISKGIDPCDAEDIILLDQRIEHYIFNVIGITSIKARFMSESKKLSNATFDLLSFKEKLTCQFAYTKILEDSIPFVKIESVMPGKCHLKHYVKEALLNLSPAIRHNLIDSKANCTSIPFQNKESWCLIYVHDLAKPKLTHETKLRVGRLLLEETVARKFASLVRSKN